MRKRSINQSGLKVQHHVALVIIVQQSQLSLRRTNVFILNGVKEK